MTLYAERQGLDSLQKKECVERRDTCAGVAKKNRADVGDKCSRSYDIVERYAVVARVRSCDVRVFAACLKVELAGFYNNAAESRSVATEELRCGMNYDVCAVLKGFVVFGAVVFSFFLTTHRLVVLGTFLGGLVVVGFLVAAGFAVVCIRVVVTVTGSVVGGGVLSISVLYKDEGSPAASTSCKIYLFINGNSRFTPILISAV